MNKDDKKRFITSSVTIAIVSVNIVTILSFLLDERTNSRNNIYILTILLVIFEITSVVLTRIEHNRNNEIDKYDKNIVKLNRLMKYNKQRDEIEQEIGKLTRELMDSNVAQYIDVNRLAFSGQNSSLMCGPVNYDNFFKQFGLEKETVTIKKGTAAFLTPFDAEGTKLFEICQTILGRINVFLRRTDTFVEKDDILMNIVSLIVQSEFVLVNIDGRNPNVYYELGIAHAIGKPTILLSKTKYTSDDIGFDLQQKKIILYNNEKDLETKLLGQINMLNRH